DTDNRDGALAFMKFMTSPEIQAELGKPFSSLPVLVDGDPTFTEDTEQAEMFMEIYAERSEPLPLVPWEDQVETTVGQAMNGMFATIATGGTVTRKDVLTAMQTAEDSIRARDAAAGGTGTVGAADRRLTPRSRPSAASARASPDEGPP